MKTKIILIAALAAVLGAGAMWISQNHEQSTTTADGRKILYYTCPMHPSVKSDKPGDCKICGMKLVPVYADVTNATAAAEASASRCGVSCPMNSKP